MLRDDVLRRPRALRLHDRRVRPLRPRQRAAARHLPERDQVRGRDHRHDARPAPRRRVTDDAPSGLVTTGGTGSILHAMLAYREHGAQDAGHHGAATSSSPRPPTPRSTRRATCSASSCARRRSTRRRRSVDVDWVADHIDDQHRRHRSARRATTATARSTRSRSCRRPRARARRRPARRRLPRRVHPPVRPGARLRHPGLRLPAPRRHDASRPTRTSTATRSRARRCCAFRDKALRNSQYFFLTDWSGGKYCSPGIEGSRSGGLLAATWAAMVSIGREGYLRYAKADLRDVVRDAGRGALAPRAAHHRRRRRSVLASRPTSSTSTTSTTSCGRGAGASTASSTRTRSTWR